ncbi:MAG TPA: YraN family protein [Methylovirgula sp.]|nr:YraN family protein [Methylovirgula sp.]
MPERWNSQPAPVEKRRRALLSGQHAEAAAALFLRLKGYRILARRYCVNGGEIDVIARKFDCVAFVEVKLRPTLLEAMTAIDERKRRRMSRAARLWLAQNPWAARLTLRADAIYLVPWRWPRHAIAALTLDIG